MVPAASSSSFSYYYYFCSFSSSSHRRTSPVRLPFLIPPLLFLTIAHHSTCSAFASPSSTTTPSSTSSLSSSSSSSSSFFTRLFSPPPPPLFAGVDPSSPIPFSSRQMSAARAIEAERPSTDRLFHDNLSQHFAGKEAMQQARERMRGGGGGGRGGSQGVGRKIAVRTRYFDDFLQDCCLTQGISEKGSRGDGPAWLSLLFRPWRWVMRGIGGGRGRKGVIDQVLILGSGMDTRAWRLPLPDVTIIEVDVAAVLQAKEQVLRLVEKEEKQQLQLQQLQQQRQQQQQQQQQQNGTSPASSIIQLTVKKRLIIPADFSSSSSSSSSSFSFSLLRPTIYIIRRRNCRSTAQNKSSLRPCH
ncbi:hypothetical protein VYU27_009540 [Nannochloropsis oceanica]